ncbi:transcriptional regulatory protein [Shewanella sp. NFH-SH190041]|uniref:response regulator n=1 Tax=Shewanella sp. NFH-SH190041 TaxID=2950245 RepID=UPI0021C4B678|nr:response regulator [Shewanella sp. NFH-SH190041]BDM64072.1 transcriptional regulatory protein [Shewanella sp. NFH-SH190041]
MHSVMIVEDEIEVAQFLTQYLLSTQQYQVVGIANDLHTARSLINAVVPDLLLLDVYLPDGDSLTMLSELRQQDIRCEVILMTAAREVDVLQQAMLLGISDFLVKPVMLSRLAQALNRYEHKQQTLNVRAELTQSMVDTMLDCPVNAPPSPRLPKGVDPLTLAKIRQLFNNTEAGSSITAVKVGEQIGVSRSTARRYLEYMVESSELKANQHYGAVGRPERHYLRN